MKNSERKFRLPIISFKSVALKKFLSFSEGERDNNINHSHEIIKKPTRTLKKVKTDSSSHTWAK